MSSHDSITKLLIEWRDGDETALNRLIPLVYEELRRMAHQRRRHERPEHTLQTTALINEAYLWLVDHKNMRWQNPALTRLRLRQCAVCWWMLRAVSSLINAITFA